MNALVFHWHPNYSRTEVETGKSPVLVPSGSENTDALDSMARNAHEAAGLLKAVAHGGRLMILCHLAKGEKSVNELETLLATRQAAVSQQLSRLRLEGLVRARRDGKAIFYSLADPRIERLIALVYDMFCT